MVWEAYLPLEEEGEEEDLPCPAAAAVVVEGGEASCRRCALKPAIVLLKFDAVVGLDVLPIEGSSDLPVPKGRCTVIQVRLWGSKEG